MKTNKARASFTTFLLSTLYYAACFFVFIFLINNVIIELLTGGEIDVSKNGLIDLSIISVIVGVTAGARVWLFAWLDKRKARKSPPSDPSA